MVKVQKNKFLPDYLVTPGEILEDYLENINMTQKDLADRTGLAVKTINEIIKGKAPITPETALKFERSLGRPANFWNSLELKYQEDKVRLLEQQKLEASLEWLKKFPVKDMCKMGWIAKSNDKCELLDEILRFFGIASPGQWPKVWGNRQTLYRQTQKFHIVAESVAVWLRKGEIEAHKIPCAPFDKKLFKEALQKVRGLTKEKTPKTFIPKLVELCAAAGVAVVFVPELPGTRVSGATQWIVDKAIIQLSLRYKTNDHLWFTFFHEAGHILLHGRKEVFIEENKCSEEKEVEANAFAQKILIPPSGWHFFMAKIGRKPLLAEIKQFAEKIDIAPGIVVGRLQREEIIAYNVGNRLKVSYRWAADPENQTRSE